MMYYTKMDGPLGVLYLAADDASLKMLSCSAPNPDEAQSLHPRENALLNHAKKELAAYFAGALRRFETPVAPEGTSFQKQVWDALLEIPYGETASYGDLAKRIGRPGAARAVGGANNKNPIAIIIPCHRVIGNDGSLTGYAGGIPRKAYLLQLERKNREQPNRTLSDLL